MTATAVAGLSMLKWLFASSVAPLYCQMTPAKMVAASLHSYCELVCCRAGSERFHLRAVGVDCGWLDRFWSWNGTLALLVSSCLQSFEPFSATGAA